MHRNASAELVIRRLNTYYDIPQLIEEELQTIRHAEEQRSQISLRSPTVNGLPGGKGQHSDRTASQALSSTTQYYDDEIIACQKRIAALRSDRDWCTAALASLSRADRRIVELAYLGPKDPKARLDWIQRPTWYSIAADMGMSISQVTTRANRIVAALADHLDQTTLSFKNL